MAIIRQQQFLMNSKKQLRNMVCHPVLGWIKGQNILEWQHTCWTIHPGDLEGGALLQGQAYITNGLRDCGGMCLLDASTLYYYVFYYMEEAGYLDVSNEVNMFCLHYVFIPRINQHLEHFINGWNDHPIRIARNKMPNQLCISGLCNIAISTVQT